MARVAVVLRKDKQNARGEHALRLRITDADRSLYESLGVYVKERDWLESRGRVRKTHPHADEINALIQRRVADAERKGLRLKAEGDAVTAADLKGALAPAPPPTDVYAYAEAVAADHEARGSYQRAQKVRTVFKKLRDHHGPNLTFAGLTPAVLRSFETYLLTTCANRPNTVRANFNAVRSVLYRAIREDHADQGANPFFRFRPVKEERTERGKLTLGELRRVEVLDLEPGSLVWRVRAYFLFSFYCAGVRFGDLAFLRHDHLSREPDGAVRMTYRMNKTGGLKSVRLLPQARSILDAFPKRPGSPYVFPILDGYDLSTGRKVRAATAAQTALANKYLKKIAALAEVATPLSTHVARHSFADVARKAGWSVYDISKALGHANLKVTETYLKGFDADALDAKMDALFG